MLMFMRNWNWIRISIKRRNCQIGFSGGWLVFLPMAGWGPWTTMTIINVTRYFCKINFMIACHLIISISNSRIYINCHIFLSFLHVQHIFYIVFYINFDATLLTLCMFFCCKSSRERKRAFKFYAVIMIIIMIHYAKFIINEHKRLWICVT